MATGPAGNATEHGHANERPVITHRWISAQTVKYLFPFAPRCWAAAERISAGYARQLSDKARARAPSNWAGTRAASAEGRLRIVKPHAGAEAGQHAQGGSGFASRGRRLRATSCKSDGPRLKISILTRGLPHARRVASRQCLYQAGARAFLPVGEEGRAG